MKTYLLEEMTWPEIQAAMKNGCDTVVIYAASIEQHGPALPEMTDTILGYAAASDLAKRLGNALAAPLIRPGLSAHHMCFPGSITLRPETFRAVVEDYISAYVHHGFWLPRTAAIFVHWKRLHSNSQNSTHMCVSFAAAVLRNWMQHLRRLRFWKASLSEPAVVMPVIGKLPL